MKTYTPLFFLVLALFVGGCGQQEPSPQPTPGYTTIAEATLNVGDPVPTPADNVVLSIEGKIAVTNVDNRLEFDMPTLERLGLITYAVDDPDLKREATYTGVPLARVLEIAQIQGDATELATTALNDYQVKIPINVLKWPVMIATMRDGKRMTIEEKGPLEIVFPNKSFQIDPIPHNPMSCTIRILIAAQAVIPSPGVYRSACIIRTES